LDLQVLQVQQVLKELAELLVIRDLLERQVQFQDQRVLQVLKDLGVLVEKQVQLDLQVLKELLDQLVQPVLLVRHQWCLDLQDLLEI
jgi:hypothetical protein